MTSGGVTCTGSDLFLVVQTTIHYCWNPCSLGAEQEILFANGARNTPVTALVTKTGGNPVPGKQVTFSIDSGGGTVAPATDTTDAAGEATTTLTAANATGRTKVKAVVANTGTARAKIYMYKQQVASGPPAVDFDFNEIISDSAFTTTPAAFDTQQEIEDWLTAKGSGLAGMTYGGTLISQIIHDAAQAQGINAQIILVTLQKEQGLISDPSPTPAKLNSAMGISPSSNIKSQIETGAQTFKNHFAAAPSMPYIFPKGTAGGTGIGYYDDVDVPHQVGVRVKINNKATYSLYKYTPWIRSTSAGGGNFLFYQLWIQYGF